MNAPPICACVWAAEPAETRTRLAALAGRAVAIELRLDRAPLDYPLGEVLAASPLPVVATCRPSREGGEWTGSEADRLEFLRRALRVGARWVDLEHDVDEFPSAHVIRSRHCFAAVESSELPGLVAATRAAGSGKLAVAVSGAEDAVQLLELAEQSPGSWVLALGATGVVSRVLGPSYGVQWVYAAEDADAPTGPGQLSVEQLTRLWEGRSSAASFYGVVGQPVMHSRSPSLFNRAFAALEVDALYTWLETGDPHALWARCDADPRWRGFSVTLPHKQAAAAWAGELSPAARATGAVNTLTRTPRGWRGTNTDAEALLELLRPRGISGADGRVLGSGGAARAACWALQKLGARVSLHARSAARGEALSHELGVAWGGDFDCVPLAAPQVIVQATSVGMTGGPDPGGALLPARAFGPQTLLYELVYTPRDTPLITRARARGAHVIDGLAHFAFQAHAQFRCWQPQLRTGPTHWEAWLASAD